MSLPPHILLVDDSATVQQLLKLAVADEGIEVAVAPSLADARAHLRQRMPELILTDVSLPDGDGYAFCREIKREKTTRDVPVLLLASSQDPLDNKLATEVGADGSLTKPFQSIGTLIERVKSLIEHRRRAAALAADEILELNTASQAVIRGGRVMLGNDEPDSVLEIDSLVIPLPERLFPSPPPGAPSPATLISDTLIEEIAARVAERIEGRISRDVIARAVPEVTRIVTRLLAEKSATPETNPTRDIDEA